LKRLNLSLQALIYNQEKSNTPQEFTFSKIIFTFLFFETKFHVIVFINNKAFFETQKMKTLKSFEKKIHIFF